MCVVDCTQFTHTDGKPSVNGICNCTCPYSWNNLTQICQFNCSTVPNSNGALNSNTCRCKTGYTWNSITSKCTLNCASISGATALNSTACNCTNSQYYFYTTATGPVCAINCTTVSYSTGIPASTSRCVCITGYSWIPSSMTCQLDCSTIANIASITSVNGTCVCNTGYFWNSLASECDVNCTTIPYSTEGVFQSPPCMCLPTFVFIYTPYFACAVDCASLTYGPDTNGDPLKCDCTPAGLTTFHLANQTCT